MSKERFKVGFVVEPYEESEASGMGYSVRETAKALAQNAHNYDLILYSGKPLDRSLIPGGYTNVLIPSSFVGKFFRFLFMRHEVDVLFFVVALLPLSVPSHTRTVVICKELPDHKLRTREIIPALRIFMRDHILMPPCMRRAARVLVSSQTTGEDVRASYNVEPARIEVIYEGYQDWSRFASGAPALDASLKPYFLFAGKVKGRKNVHGIVRAFIAFKERTGSDAQLLIAGSYGGDYYAAMDRELTAHDLRGEVHFLGYVTAPMMYTLYANASALVFASLSEGFGMPLVEAMSLGVPVIASAIPVFSEIVGKAGLLVDPYNPIALAHAMEQILSDAALRADLIQKGRERAELYSWDKVREKYAQVVQQLMSHAF